MAQAENEEAVVVVFDLTAEDIDRAFADNPVQRKTRRWSLLFLAILPLAYVATGTRSYTSGEALSSALLFFVLPMVFAVALFLFFLRLARPGPRTLATFRDEDRRQTYRFERDAFEVRTGTTQARVAYRGLHAFTDGKDALLLFTRPNVMHLVPKRVLSLEELERVTGWLRAGVEPPQRTFPLVRVLVIWVVLIVAFLAIWLVLTPN
jgi:Mn2+/Fe2+ NRAMP family transporter